ncbi:MAG: sigma-54 dependent transcriptional regulator [Vicinamibacteria bacterium]
MRSRDDLSAPGRRILVVDDDPITVRLAEAVLRSDGDEVVTAGTAEQALEAMEGGRFDLVLTDLRLPAMSGLDLVERVKVLSPDTALLVMTSFASVSSAVQAMRTGAVDYIVKPFDAQDLKHRVDQAIRLSGLETENRRLRENLAEARTGSRLVAHSAVIRSTLTVIERLARTDLTVFLVGESGSGKEVLARSLHDQGARAGSPFIAVNCAALPRDLAESELFGSAKGAFTGAHRDRVGKFEAAHGGTLFLDEVVELPSEVQPKLLRALETRAIERVGENVLRRIDVRIVAAANRDPRVLVSDGRFREDLYFRLAVAPVRVPPLRERVEDVGPLARHFLARAAGENPPELTAGAVAALERLPWPGNVRELKNLIERTVALHDGGPITAESLRFGAYDGPPPHPGTESPAALDSIVKDALVSALEQTSWNVSAAARRLQTPRHILKYRMAKYGIRPPARSR